jgi:hypothetical protein
MSATATRSTQGTVEPRQLLAAIGAMILAVALLVAVGAARQGSTQSIAPAAASGATVHDHGWSATSSGQSANDFDKAHAPKSAPDSDLLVIKTRDGGVVYTGIPYPAPEPVRGTGGANGTRFAR